MVEIGAEILAL